MRNLKGKVIATVSAMTLAATTLAGCSSAPKTDSMFEVAGIVKDLDSYSYTMDIEFENDGEEVELSIFGKCSKDAASLGFKAKVDGEKYGVDELLIATKDSMYFNLADIMDEFAGDFDLGAYGIDADWLMVEWDEVETEEVDTDDIDTIIKDAEKAYEDLISKKDGKYVIKIDDKESAMEFVEATKDLLDDKAGDWSVIFADMYNNFDITTSNEVMKSVMSNILKDVNRSIDAGYSASEIDEIVEESFEMDESEFVKVEASEIEDSILDIVDELEELIEESEEDDDEIGGVFKITTYQNKNTYVTEFSAIEDDDEDKEGGKFVFRYTIVSEKVEIKVPTKDVMTVGDAIGAAINKFGADVDLEDLASEIDLEDLMYELGFGYGFDLDDLYGDYDDYYDDYYDDMYW